MVSNFLCILCGVKCSYVEYVHCVKFTRPQNTCFAENTWPLLHPPTHSLIHVHRTIINDEVMLKIFDHIILPLVHPEPSNCDDLAIHTGILMEFMLTTFSWFRISLSLYAHTLLIWIQVQETVFFQKMVNFNLLESIYMSTLLLKNCAYWKCSSVIISSTFAIPFRWKNGTAFVPSVKFYVRPFPFPFYAHFIEVFSIYLCRLCDALEY